MEDVPPCLAHCECGGSISCCCLYKAGNVDPRLAVLQAELPRGWTNLLAALGLGVLGTGRGSAQMSSCHSG